MLCHVVRRSSLLSSTVDSDLKLMTVWNITGEIIRTAVISVTVIYPLIMVSFYNFRLGLIFLVLCISYAVYSVKV